MSLSACASLVGLGFNVIRDREEGSWRLRDGVDWFWFCFVFTQLGWHRYFAGEAVGFGVLSCISGGRSVACVMAVCHVIRLVRPEQGRVMIGKQKTRMGSGLPALGFVRSSPAHFRYPA